MGRILVNKMKIRSTVLANKCFPSPEIILDAVTYKIAGQSAPLLNNISATWKPGRVVVLQGVSGSGKSTLLSIATGLLYPTAGTVRYGDIPLDVTHEQVWRDLRARYIGYVFQSPLLIPELSVLENIMTRGIVQGKNTYELEAEAHELLVRLDMSSAATKHPFALSGGEQQRISLARALMGSPQFLILDEPTAHLDSAARNNFRDVLVALSAQRSLGVIIATHDDALAQEADEIWMLEAGTLRRKG